MANDSVHYRELAARAQREAYEATLDNVRDRALRSAATFESMAVQHEKTAKRRAEREAATMHAKLSADLANPKELL